MSSISWEQRKLLDCIQKITDFRGRTPKKLGMDWSEEGYLALSALNVKDGYIDYNQDVHYGNQELYDKWMTGNELHKGQVLFTTEAPMGNVAQVPDNRRYILSQRVIALDVKNNLLTENFLATVLRTPTVFAYLTALSSGGTAKGVSQKSLSSVEIRLPKNLKEQEKIADTFSYLDTLITLHQSKAESWKNKKNQLSTISWEQRKLGEISNKVTKKNQDAVVDEVFTNSAEFGIISQRDFFEKDIANAENIDGYYVVEPDDFVYNPRISTTAPYGPIKRNKLERTGAMSPLYYVFRPYDIDLSFLEWYFQTTCWHVFMRFNGNSGARSDRFAITDKIFNEIPISMPQDIEEQKLIGTFLTKLESLITLHQRKKNLLVNQ